MALPEDELGSMGTLKKISLNGSDILMRRINFTGGILEKIWKRFQEQLSLTTVLLGLKSQHNACRR